MEALTPVIMVDMVSTVVIPEAQRMDRTKLVFAERLRIVTVLA